MLWGAVDQEGRYDLREIVVGSNVGNVDIAPAFVLAVKHTIIGDAEVIKSLSKEPFDADAARYVISDAEEGKHMIYYLEIDAVGHQCVLELQRGRARVFQSSPNSAEDDEFYRPLVSVGYSGREWATVHANESWPEVTQAVHKRWGGGRELSMRQLKRYMATWLHLQVEADDFLRRLVPLLPQPIRKAQKSWKRSCESVGLVMASPIFRWAGAILADIRTVTLQHDADSGVDWILTNPYYEGPEPFSFPLPREEQVRFDAAFIALTGVEPTVATYMALLHFYGWEETDSANVWSEQEPFGWAYTVTEIEEEGNQGTDAQQLEQGQQAQEAN